ncbi:MULTISPECIES: hypothetical protein [unclassified Flavobacterium]|uniref:hypothetical protein n=1 Tax=unclassified Flavobacterium TaxID=196869 RepID=UPI0006ABB295|nr:MULTISPECIES: hypothetical protein [unclassified Flavobacterium]KOP37109.1 hypothetical protein AKO67_16825 [Flavobacterium sp. VMW]OWU89474.1 hypothetical protein APR43_16990 [Flavobacterium sp. NLM]
MEKFEIDIKWGSYFFIANMTISIIIVLLMFLINNYSLIYLYDALIPVFIIQLIYFTIKAARENNQYHLSKGLRKIFVFVRLLVFYYLLAMFPNTTTNDSNSSIFFLFLPYRKKDISELVEHYSDEDDEITLKEFMVRLKRKFSRA